MKTCAAVTFTVLIIAATFDSAMGLAKYLDELPNGSSFSQELGHPGSDSSKFTDFATAFADAGHSWTAEFCGKTFPGASMTNGEAFGDPCCTWTKGGGAPDSSVAAFTTKPTKATTCASTSQTSTASSTAASTASSTAASSAGSSTTAASTASSTAASSAGSSTSTTTDTPATTDALAATDVPASTTAPSTPSGGCAAKGAGGKGPSKGSYSFRH